MKGALAVLVIALAGAISSGGGPTWAATPPAPRPAGHAAAVADHLIVGFDRGQTRAQRAATLRAAGARPLKDWAPIEATLARVPAAAAGTIKQRLLASPGVRYVERDTVLHAGAVVPSDPLFGDLWGLNNTGQTVNFSPGTPDADIDAPEAWSVSTGSSSQTVAVIDTGIDASHPDLAANMWINPGENCAGCRTDGIDNDGNGYVDDWRGWDFANNDNNPDDDNGHGTHVAGTIGAVGDNRIGVTGVDWHVKLMPLKFLGADGSGTTSDAISALLYASANGADVSNNSYGGDTFSQAMFDAIHVADQHGSLFVAAAGNSSADLDTAPSYPASYSSPNVISVAATTNTDQRAWFSNYGAASVDLGAPGQDIESTWPGGGYQYLSGTSMAAPQVAGAAALVKSAAPGATAAGLKALLASTVDSLASLTGTTESGGRLNVDSAIRCSGRPMLVLRSPAAGFITYAGAAIPVSVIATDCAVPAGVTISVTLDGADVALADRGDGVYTGTATAPASGQTTVTARATVGSQTVIRSVTGSVAPQIVPGGAAVTLDIPTAGGSAAAVFGGSAGQRVSLAMSASSLSSAKVSLVDPSGATFASATIGTSGGFIDTRQLSQDGIYLIIVKAASGASGSVTLTLYDVPPDLTAGITADATPVTVTTTVPGQNARLTFTATAGQRVSLKITNTTYSSTGITLQKPDTTTLASTTVFSSTATGFIDTTTLPTTGTYTLLIDPKTTSTGSTTLTLYTVPPDLTASISIGGPAVGLTLSIPGQNARLAFSGNASQTVTLTASSVTLSLATLSILRPDGTTLKSLLVGTGGGSTAATLPVTGSYTLVVDPQSTATGSITVKLT